MFTREKLENNQVWLYVIVLAIAAGFGLLTSDFAGRLDGSISIIIAILMYSMFSQIPFVAFKEAFGNRRFIFAILTVNYIAVPIVVWFLSNLLPDHPPVLLGVYLVLLNYPFFNTASIHFTNASFASLFSFQYHTESCHLLYLTFLLVKLNPSRYLQQILTISLIIHLFHLMHCSASN
ncbi:hypothetical protein [Lederbergia citrisecunda]|uniref:hypothetical protein n=1 Tax=Lederbergia citrisecunda TaxID=2833583 RepID=UPI003D2673AB